MVREMSLAEQVRAVVEGALREAARAGAFGDGVDPSLFGGAAFTVERPKRPEHGDLATNAPMVLTKKLGRPPRAIAEALVKALDGSLIVRTAEIAGPGFVNLRVHPRALHAELDAILLAGSSYGRAPSATRDRINLEFVSANPTGPVTVASGRNAIYGDAIARLLEATGNRVTREYYINDRGNQVRMLAESVRAAAEGKPTPENGYKGAYVAELARWLERVEPELLAGADIEALGRVSVTWMLRGIPGSRTLPGIRPSLRDLGVVFDVWFSEESLHRWGAVSAVIRQLDRAGYLEHKDGALFFRPKEAGEGDPTLHEDKDRVVRKSDGSWAYFASDIAYLADKIGRGYDRLVYVLGADHHGALPRLKNAMLALGLPLERFEALLYQLVFITHGGEAVKSSKREGKFVTVDEVMSEIDEAAGRKGAGADALRFFFLSRSANSNVDFDLDLAKKSSLDNPVFYVQYGHARLSSILRKATEIGIPQWTYPRTSLPGAAWASLVHADELTIAAHLSEFPSVVETAAEERAPHRVVFYVQELAQSFQSYFTRLKDDPILPRASERAKPGWEKTWDHDKTVARLAWIEAIRNVYASALGLLGVSAPERMDRPKDGSVAAAAGNVDGDEDETASLGDIRGEE
jgi:arginyl-tRNA synthetase